MKHKYASTCSLPSQGHTHRIEPTVVEIGEEEEDGHEHSDLLYLHIRLPYFTLLGF